jgi:hypothetical protein
MPPYFTALSTSGHKKREAPAGFAHGVSLVYRVKTGYAGISAGGET